MISRCELQRHPSHQIPPPDPSEGTPRFAMGVVMSQEVTARYNLTRHVLLKNDPEALEPETLYHHHHHQG